MKNNEDVEQNLGGGDYKEEEKQTISYKGPTTPLNQGSQRTYELVRGSLTKLWLTKIMIHHLARRINQQMWVNEIHHWLELSIPTQTNYLSPHNLSSVIAHIPHDLLVSHVKTTFRHM